MKNPYMRILFVEPNRRVREKSRRVQRVLAESGQLGTSVMVEPVTSEVAPEISLCPSARSMFHWLEPLPVTQEAAGSSPVGPAIQLAKLFSAQRLRLFSGYQIMSGLPTNRTEREG
jgi:hypothetical protein